jgi:Tol biopolymer transport system component
VGSNLVAFLSGRVGEPPVLTIATLPEGRIVRRLEETRGIAPQGLVASPDGRTLYYVNAGALYAIDAEKGAPRKMRAANGVALDTRAPAALVVQINEPNGVKLVRVPLDGGSELPILFAGTLRLAPVPISGAAVGPDGRIAVTVTAPDQLWRGIALLDPASATLERIPVAYDGDVEYPVWSLDGSLIAIGVSPRSSLWRFQPNPR